MAITLGVVWGKVFFSTRDLTYGLVGPGTTPGKTPRISGRADVCIVYSAERLTAA